MRKRWLALVAAVLVMPASAVAGGWATVQLSSTPTGLSPGEAWNVDLEILQHGRTPLEGVEPKVVVSGPGGASRTFAAEPGGKPGTYTARVVFDAPGRWTYEVDDGFTQTHSYPPVTIGAASPAEQTAGTSEDGPPWVALAAALCAGLLVAGSTARLRRRRS